MAKDSSLIYRCSYPSCTRSFNRKPNLTGHLRSHTGERVRCSFCATTFRYNSDRAVHERSQHGGIDARRRYFCSGCHKSYTENKSLLRHLRSDAGKSCRRSNDTVDQLAVVRPPDSQTAISVLEREALEDVNDLNRQVEQRITHDEQRVPVLEDARKQETDLSSALLRWDQQNRDQQNRDQQNLDLTGFFLTSNDMGVEMWATYPRLIIFNPILAVGRRICEGSTIQRTRLTEADYPWKQQFILLDAYYGISRGNWCASDESADEFIIKLATTHKLTPSLREVASSYPLGCILLFILTVAQLKVVLGRTRAAIGYINLATTMLRLVWVENFTKTRARVSRRRRYPQEEVVRELLESIKASFETLEQHIPLLWEYSRRNGWKYERDPTNVELDDLYSSIREA